MSSDKKPEPNYKAIEELLLFGKYPDDMSGKPEKKQIFAGKPENSLYINISYIIDIRIKTHW